MAWMDRRWFTFEALMDEWRRKNLRSQCLGFATAVAVFVLCMNPGTLATAVYIDSVGIDAFLALLELNILVGLLLYRQELVSLYRATCTSKTAIGTALRKAEAFPCHLQAALRGGFQ